MINEANNRKAWDILHKLECNFGYLLMEMSYKELDFHRSALKMIFELAEKQLKEAKVLIKSN